MNSIFFFAGDATKSLQSSLSQASTSARENALAMGERAKSSAVSIKDGVSSAAVSRGNMTNFFMLFGAGAGLISLATTFLPTMVVAPQKFGMLFGTFNLVYLVFLRVDSSES